MLSIDYLQGKIVLGTLYATSTTVLKPERWGVPLVQEEKYKKNTVTIKVDKNTPGLVGYVTGR
jgi:hypothetical protein